MVPSLDLLEFVIHFLKLKLRTSVRFVCTALQNAGAGFCFYIQYVYVLCYYACRYAEKKNNTIVLAFGAGLGNQISKSICC